VLITSEIAKVLYNCCVTSSSLPFNFTFYLTMICHSLKGVSAWKPVDRHGKLWECRRPDVRVRLDAMA